MNHGAALVRSLGESNARGKLVMVVLRVQVLVTVATGGFDVIISRNHVAFPLTLPMSALLISPGKQIQLPSIWICKKQ